MTVALKDFPFAFDGIHFEDVVAGDDRDFGVSTAGLVAGGYLEAGIDQPTPSESESERPARGKRK